MTIITAIACKQTCKHFPQQLIIFLLILFAGIQHSAYGQSKISGTLKYNNSLQTPLDGVRIYLETPAGDRLDSTNTNQHGLYIFQQAAEGQYFVSPVCNKPWSGTNSTDAFLIQKHIVGLLTLTGLPLAAADVDLSGSVTVVDALQVLQRFVGLINTFQSGDWVVENNIIDVDGINPFQHDVRALCSGDVNASYTPPPCQPHPTTADAGPDIFSIPGTTVILNANQPVLGDGYWQVIAGSGYNITSASSADAVFTGMAGNSYTLVWNISTSCYTSTDTLLLSFAPPLPAPCPGLPSFEYGGQTYNTVQIGSQCWMRENLNIGTMLTDILSGTAFTLCSDNGIIEKYCYNNDPAYCAIYGGLYDWAEMMQYMTTPSGQGICPEGWHIPSTTDYNTLINYFGGQYTAGEMIKEAGYEHWDSPNIATNESGFTALGAGVRILFGGTGLLKINTLFWTSNQENEDEAYLKAISNDYAWFWDEYRNKKWGLSVRCLKN